MASQIPAVHWKQSSPLFPVNQLLPHLSAPPFQYSPYHATCYSLLAVRLSLPCSIFLFIPCSHLAAGFFIHVRIGRLVIFNHAHIWRLDYHTYACIYRPVHYTHAHILWLDYPSPCTLPHPPYPYYPLSLLMYRLSMYPSISSISISPVVTIWLRQPKTSTAFHTLPPRIQCLGQFVSAYLGRHRKPSDWDTGILHIAGAMGIILVLPGFSEPSLVMVMGVRGSPTSCVQELLGSHGGH